MFIKNPIWTLNSISNHLNHNFWGRIHQYKNHVMFILTNISYYNVLQYKFLSKPALVVNS
jgi:hypothetical protein